MPKAHRHHHDPLAVEPRRRHPPRRELILLIPVPQVPVRPVPRRVDAAALRHRRGAGILPAGHHQHRVVVTLRPQDEAAAVAEPEPPVLPAATHEQVACVRRDAHAALLTESAAYCQTNTLQNQHAGPCAPHRFLSRWGAPGGASPGDPELAVPAAAPRIKGTMLADGGAQTLPGRCSRPGLPFAPALSGTAEFEEAWNRLLPKSTVTPPIQVF